MDIVVKSVQMSTVKAGVVVARDQHLVPVWEDTEPLEEIKCSCLGSRYREITAVHEDIRLREVPQAAVYPVGIGQIKDGAKLINSRGMNPPPACPRSFQVPCQDIQGISH